MGQVRAETQPAPCSPRCGPWCGPKPSQKKGDIFFLHDETVYLLSHLPCVVHVEMVPSLLRSACSEGMTSELHSVPYGLAVVLCMDFHQVDAS